MGRDAGTSNSFSSSTTSTSTSTGASSGKNDAAAGRLNDFLSSTRIKNLLSSHGHATLAAAASSSTITSSTTNTPQYSSSPSAPTQVQSEQKEEMGQLYPHSKFLVAWSPDGRYVASISKKRLTVRDPTTMLIECYRSLFSSFSSSSSSSLAARGLQQQQQMHESDWLEWGADSDLIVCARWAREGGREGGREEGVVEAFRVSDSTWSCRITAGAAGFTYACLSPSFDPYISSSNTKNNSSEKEGGRAGGREGQYLLTVSDLWLSLSLWSLEDEEEGQEEVFSVALPKVNVKPAFSPDGSLLLVARRREGRDEVGLYGRRRRGGSEGGRGREGGRAGGGWVCLRSFLPETADLVALEWGAGGRYFLIRDTPLVGDGLYVYSPDGGKLLWKLEEGKEGSIAGGGGGGGGLGVKSVALSGGGGREGGREWLAVGGWDGRVRVWSTLTWGLVLEGKCGKKEGIRDGGREGGRGDDGPSSQQRPAGAEGAATANTNTNTSSNTTTNNNNNNSSSNSGSSSKPRTRSFVAYTQQQSPYDDAFHPSLPPSLPFLKPDLTKAFPKMGIGLMAWSTEGGRGEGWEGGRFLLTRNDSMPRVLWVWDLEVPGLAAVLTFAAPVRSAQWSPSSPPSSPSTPPSLCIVTGGPRFYVWSPAVREGGGEGGLPDPPAWYDLPVGDGGHFDVMKVRWAPREGGREGGVEGKVGAVGRRIETMRLEGGGEEGAEGGEVEEEDEVFLIALMSSEYWCVCALNQ
ncbi:hypothetical protein VYU27_006615 [Nannochloropsis oceanica]